MEVGSAASRALRFGLEYSRVHISGRPCLDRWILYLGGTLRLHRFHRGDDARAPHSHPWWFVTFPFTSYMEVVHEDGRPVEVRMVKAWRFHYRPSNFQHIVMGRDRGTGPFWTIVLTGRALQEWGFYPAPGKFVSYKNWPGALE